MKKYLLLLILAGALQNAIAQISIQPILPLAGMVQKNNLWNIAVINTSSDTYNNCRIELTLRDRASGLEVITATTGLFQLGAGAKQLNTAFLMPIQYNYFSSAVTNRTDDFIPIGNYTACYRLTINGKVPVAEECVAFDVEPLSPPMLITPADSAVLEVAPSQFTWIPPAPLNLFSRLDYEVVITEIQPGQKAEEAMQQNLPFYTEPNIPVNNLAYTGAAANFEKDKWYAWQVIAKDDRNYAGKSEVWVFKVSNEQKVQPPTNDFYLLMEDNVKGTYKINSKTLRIKYPSQTNAFEAQVIFTDETGSTIKTTKQKIVQGDNYLDFTLNNQFKQNKVYAVSIKDQNNKARTITFSIYTK
jgi:hypothetical protein